MLRRLHHDQPENFAYTPDNLKWAEAQMTKFPEGRQASAVIPLLWRAQEQEGWLSRPAIEEVGRMLDMAYIRVLEVATFYFMFQLQPVGNVAHVQVCGTTSCMICGAEDLVALCRDRIAPEAHGLSGDGKFSWEEVECLGACSNAPMVQIGKDYYEDLTAERLGELLDALAAGEVPVPGPQTGRFASEPAGGLTSLDGAESRGERNASVALAHDQGDTIRRIDGSELPVTTPWTWSGHSDAAATPPPVRDDLMPPRGVADGETPGATPTEGKPADETGATRQESTAENKARPNEGSVAPGGPQSANEPESADDAVAGSAPDAGSPPPAEGRGASGGGEAPLADHDGPGDSDEQAAEGEDDSGAEADNNAAADVAEGEETRPERLEGPRDGGADDLKLIKGVGPKLEELLHELGFFHFDQVAAWSAREIAWVDRNLDGFKGRVIRDNWVGQARILARGGETEFSKRAKT